jgi:hypothetical protein
MISIVKASKPYSPENGDILCGSEYICGEIKKGNYSLEVITDLSHVSSGVTITPMVVDLSFICNNPWKALSTIGVDYSEFIKKVTYDDYLTTNKYFWFVPDKMLLCGGIFGYTISPSNLRYQTLNIREPGKIQASFMGHGYTIGTLPSDGENDYIHAYVKLSNGDILYGFCWVWFNK